MKQTILGAGGAIGIPLARELKKYTDEIRLVSRLPKKVNGTDELYPLDVSDLSQLSEAIKGSEIVYVTIGFEYNLKIWQEKWPPFMETVIEACQTHGTKLVFFDNVYMYSKSSIPLMTEKSPILPPSGKGVVRNEIAQMIITAIEEKKITALIARAADFYGPDNKNSVLGQMVASNLLVGKKAQTFGNPAKIHTYTYTPDAAKAMAQLGNTQDAYNQVWHLPTTKELLTGRQWIDLFASSLGMKPKIQHVPNWMLWILGLFMPVMKEFPEMMYQYDQDYIFDSSKFEKKFGWSATSPAEGVRAMLDSMKTVK
ncbi:MAG: NAD-dependent epimerase/dehydratase family protein [Prolixibacteraceae bacterium]